MLCISHCGHAHARSDRDADHDTQATWHTSNVELNAEPFADMLAGSLEYSWSNSGSQSSQSPSSHRPLSGQSASAADKVRLQDLESAFDASALTSRLEAAMNTQGPPPLLGSNGNPRDCVLSVDAAVDASLGLTRELSQVSMDNPDLIPVLTPLSEILVVLDAQNEDDLAAMATAMRTLKMGLIGFHHVVGYIAETIVQSDLPKVVRRAEALQRRADDVISCVDGSSVFELQSSTLPLSSSPASCKAVQTFYDDYFDQVKSQINTRLASAASSSSDPSMGLLREALASLQFQQAGAYLTSQGALDLAARLQESEPSKETMSLVAAIQRTAGAGDALQACQVSVRKGAIRQAARTESISEFEQLIYSQLAMNVKRKNPIARVEVDQQQQQQQQQSPITVEGGSSGVYGDCQPLFEEALSTAKTLELDIIGAPKTTLPETAAAKMARTILQRYIHKFQERLQRPLEEDNRGSADIELQQLETAMAVLVRIIKNMPASNTYGVMKQSLYPLMELELRVHRMSGCMLENMPSTVVVEGEEKMGEEERTRGRVEVQTGVDALRCDVLADGYRASLAEVLKRVKSVAENTANTSDKDLVVFLKENVQVLIENAESWDETTEHNATEGEEGREEGKAGDSLTSGAILKAIASRSQTARSKLLQGLTELVPFMMAQVNSLEACSNVWRTTEGVQSESETRGRGVDDLDFDEDKEEDTEDEYGDGGDKHRMEEDASNDENEDTGVENEQRAPVPTVEKMLQNFYIEGDMVEGVDTENVRYESTYDCSAIISELGTKISTVSEAVDIVKKQYPLLGPTIEQAALASQRVERELALRRQDSQYHLRSLWMTFTSAAQSLTRVLPTQPELQPAYDKLNELATVTLSARTCMSKRPEGTVVADEDDEDDEDDDEDQIGGEDQDSQDVKENKLITAENRVCEPLGQMLRAQVKSSLAQAQDEKKKTEELKAGGHQRVELRETTLTRIEKELAEEEKRNGGDWKQSLEVVEQVRWSVAEGMGRGHVEGEVELQANALAACISSEW
ncbi:hypothetical protein BGZ98_009680 [Dissophora globulifera]|nr:hypothetical protein BGZ98_009680 [Dissophora globulifera]